MILTGGINDSVYIDFQLRASPYTSYGKSISDKDGVIISDFSSLDDNTDFYVIFRVVNGYSSSVNGLIFKPMIRPSGTSPDYVPYMRSNLELTHDTDGVRGVGRNLLEIMAESQTVNGIKFTVDKAAGTITANGTATADAGLRISKYFGDILTANAYYVMNGCPSGGSTNTYKIFTGYNVDNINDIGTGVQFTFLPNIANRGCWIYIISGTTVSNLVFKPMLRSAKYTDDSTFYPYSENEIDFQSKLRPITVGTMYDADSVAAVHNAHPRGKNITDIFNAGELSGMISSGLFDEIYPGDYFSLPMAAVTDRWSARTFTCRVAHINPYKYAGDGTLRITDNHIGFITDESWFTCPWNESGTTEGGYAGSTIHGRINEEAIITAWQNALSGKLTLMQARMLLSNAINKDVDSAERPGQKGMASGWGYRTDYFKLMSEMEIYGAPVWSSGGFNTGTSNYQLSCFSNNTGLLRFKQKPGTFLSDVISVSYAAYADGGGVATNFAVSTVGSVHPLGFLKS